MMARGDREPRSVPDSWYEEERIMVPSNPDRMVDLRSDTVTTPTPEMRRAMAEAEVGDDVFMEDPTVLRLEALAAERLGKEAALFVTSGTQGNQVSLMAHTQRGDEIILDENCHIFNYEVAALAVLSAVQARTLARAPRHPGPRRRPRRHPAAQHPLSAELAHLSGKHPQPRRRVGLSSRDAARDPADRDRSTGWPSTWTGPGSSTRAWRWASRRRRWPRRRTR